MAGAGYRTWKDIERDGRHESAVAPDGFPWPDDPAFASLLASYYAAAERDDADHSAIVPGVDPS